MRLVRGWDWWGVRGEAGDRVGLVRLGVVRRREECES